MANSNRTGQQKALGIFAIIATIMGLITLVTALMIHFASGMYASIIGQEMVDLLDSVWVTSVVDGVLVTLMGVTGIWASRNASHSGLAAVFGTIAVIFTFYMQSQTGGGIIQQFEAGNFNPYVAAELLVVAITSGLAVGVAFDAGRGNK